MNFCEHCNIYTPFSECILCHNKTIERYKGYKNPFFIVHGENVYPIMPEESIQNLMTAKMTSYLMKYLKGANQVLIPILENNAKKTCNMYICHSCKNIMFSNERKKLKKCSCGKTYSEHQKITQPFLMVSCENKSSLWAMIPHLWMDVRFEDGKDTMTIIDEFAFGFIN
jgi:hypothetical protein